jgi:RNA polymerase sigma factor for flagellar operon FliA
VTLEAGGQLTADQQRLVTEHQHVVRRVLRRFWRCRAWLSRDDLEQAAHLGLINAARVFRPEDGIPFAGFCWAHVMGAVLRAVDREAHQRKIADAVVDHMATARRQGSVLTDTLSSAGRELREHAKQAMLAFVMRAAMSPEPAGAEQRALHAERARAIRDAVSALGGELRELIDLHYYQDVDLKEAAARLDISYATVRRRHAAALTLLAVRLRFEGVDG